MKLAYIIEKLVLTAQKRLVGYYFSFVAYIPTNILYLQFTFVHFLWLQ